VTRQVPFIPNGCHKADDIADCDVTWVVGPSVYVFSRIGPVSGAVRCDDSGNIEICTVCVVRIARKVPFGEIISCRISSATVVLIV
jgi:hypothetical protein